MQGVGIYTGAGGLISSGGRLEDASFQSVFHCVRQNEFNCGRRDGHAFVRLVVRVLWIFSSRMHHIQCRYCRRILDQNHNVIRVCHQLECIGHATGSTREIRLGQSFNLIIDM
jgi:hypothetical protein